MNKVQNRWLVLVAIWMVVIFSFSSKPSDESSQDSLFVGELVGRIFIPKFETWDKEEQKAFAERIEHPVRKTAHATEYAILGFLLFQTLKYRTDRGRKRTVFDAWILGTAYAATDEIHQIFVPGRAGMATDVMIDSGGVLTGVLLGILLYKVIKRKEREEKDGSKTC